MLVHLLLDDQHHRCRCRAGEYGFDDEAARRALSADLRHASRSVSNQCRAGATAAVLLLQNGGHCLNVAWVGDCRAVLCRAGTRSGSHATTHPSRPVSCARVLRGEARERRQAQRVPLGHAGVW